MATIFHASEADETNQSGTNLEKAHDQTQDCICLIKNDFPHFMSRIPFARYSVDVECNLQNCF